MFMCNFQLCIRMMRVTVNCSKAVASDLDSQILLILTIAMLGV